MYLSSSEFVSSGHPDRVSDNLGAIVIQDIQKKDGPFSHAAIEVFLTHSQVIFAGEATTTLKITDDYLREVVKLGFKRSGYLPEMRKYWTKDEVALADDLEIVNQICPQSPDIALGTTDKGENSSYNDQGVYFSSSEATNPKKMGTPMLVAQAIGDFLSTLSKHSILAGGDFILGPDNKVVVTCRVADDGFSPVDITAITIAVAHTTDVDIEALRAYIKSEVTGLLSTSFPYLSLDGCEWVINGTGRFVVHGCISDTSMTGRKISVNHPSAGPVWCNKMIGGGSLVKPWHASDFLLNVVARFIANVVVEAGLSDFAVVGCAGAIGQDKPQSLFIHADHDLPTSVFVYFTTQFNWKPIAIARKFNMFSENFDFGQVVDKNFFGDPSTQPWEGELVKEEAKKLFEFIGQ